MAGRKADLRPAGEPAGWEAAMLARRDATSTDPGPGLPAKRGGPGGCEGRRPVSGSACREGAGCSLLLSPRSHLQLRRNLSSSFPRWQGGGQEGGGRREGGRKRAASEQVCPSLPADVLPPQMMAGNKTAPSVRRQPGKTGRVRGEGSIPGCRAGDGSSPRDLKFIRPEEDIHMTPILDGMCERIIFPDISKGRTEDCRKAPGQNPLCYRASVEDPLTSNACQEAV
ncbi:uncharacterized protein LOC121673717 [Corvus kubaryi]|uniref:uncharacterized protein LOC121673717 n=1 Tax=Corvus kubaryi TaxID=68294 RepID=UPI001C043593|nr:uncharacterized protein LOC121673717 [Corvus kubaryi]